MSRNCADHAPPILPKTRNAPHLLAGLPAGKRFHVHGVGLCAVDYCCRVDRLPAVGEKRHVDAITRQAGGQTGTALTALSRWGLQTVYSGKFGDDANGRYGLDQLAEEGVHLDGVIVAAGVASQSAMIIIEATSGERTILWQRDAEAMLQPENLNPQLTEASQALLIDGYEIEAAIEAARTARRAGAIVLLDAEEVAAERRVNDLLALCDIVIGCAEFPHRFTQIEDRQTALHRLQACLPPGGLAGCTLGSAGAALFDGARYFFSPAYAVQAVDTTGAGDVFHAAFLYATLTWPQRDLRFRLDFANACAALSCTALGARAGIPHLDDALRLVRERRAERGPQQS